MGNSSAKVWPVTSVPPPQPIVRHRQIVYDPAIGWRPRASYNEHWIRSPSGNHFWHPRPLWDD